MNSMEFNIIERIAPGTDGLLANVSVISLNSWNILRVWGFRRDEYRRVKKWKYTNGVNKPARPMNNRITTKGIRNISVNAISRRIFLVWNSTREISIRAPHHEFCPRSWKFDKAVNHRGNRVSSSDRPGGSTAGSTKVTILNKKTINVQELIDPTLLKKEFRSFQWCIFEFTPGRHFIRSCQPYTWK